MKTGYQLTLSIVLAFTFGTKAQEWVTLMQNPAGKNFYEIQASFNNYWKDKDVNVPGNGYKPFKRWEYFVERRVYPSGDLSLLNQTFPNFEAFLKQEQASGKKLGSNNLIASTTWTAMGPMGPMVGVATNGFPRKAGRDNFIAFHPTQANTFWAGAGSGGLWKTTNGGTSWTTNTDNLPVIGCTDLAIDPTTPNTMYLATGDGYGNSTYCIGVLKSTDGGATWNNSGLTFPVSQQVLMRRLIINPNNPQILLAATNLGIYRTTDAGVSWSNVVSGNFYDLEFKPGNPNVVYAGAGSFFLSTNGGASFTQISNGITTSGVNRMSLAVTPADANYVYVLCSSSSSNGFFGLYRSVNSGTSFTQMSTSPDVLANSCSGTAGGGQGWYDLCMAVSPTNRDIVNVGGVNVWRSNSGGATGTWTCIGCWIGTSAPAVYLKADHHDLEYGPNGVLYSATDGGIFSYNTTNWIDLNAGRNIAQIYKIGLSSLSANRWITGHQDNGSNIYTNGTYSASMAGDGMDCFIDRTNDQNMFASTPNGGFSRSTTGGSSWTGATNGMSGGADWVAPWKQDPQVATRLYAGRSQMFVSNNLGANWTALTSTGGSGNIIEFAIAPSNNQVIYVIHGTSIRKTTNGGTSWTNVTGTLPVGSGAPTFITISPTDPNKAWVTLSGYSAGNKVFQTVNGGTSWTNISSNLPNIPANCSVYQLNTGDRIYVGMDVGVYYKDNSSSSWTLYNTGLPNTPVHDLEISPANPGRLRAATYGRGVYEVDLIASTPQAPVSDFSTSGNICPGTPKVIYDNSANIPTSWSWTIQPSQGVVLNSNTSQNPSVTFPAAGVYTVSLIASNGIGSGGLVTKTVNVLASPDLTLNTTNQVVCINDDAQMQAAGAVSYTWQPGFFSGPTVFLVTTNTQVVTYTCTGLGSNGCTGQKTILVEISECLGLKNNASVLGVYEVFPNPATTAITVKYNAVPDEKTEIVVCDVTGKVAMKQTVEFGKTTKEVKLNISGLPAGVYQVKLTSQSGKQQVVKILKE